MIAGAFNHRNRTGVTHCEALAGDAVEESLAGNRTVQHRVAGDNVIDRTATELGVRTHDNAAAGQSLADVVIALANQIQCHAMCQERACRLACGTLQLDMDGVVGQALMTVFLRNFT